MHVSERERHRAIATSGPVSDGVPNQLPGSENLLLDESLAKLPAEFWQKGEVDLMVVLLLSIQ